MSDCYTTTRQNANDFSRGSGHRGHGIGTALTRVRLRRLRQPTIVESWIRTDSPDSTVILENLGFEEVTMIRKKWYEESIESDDENFCPDCGSVCECDSAVYILRDSF